MSTIEVTRKPAEFRPVTITIRTQDELDAVFRIMDSASFMGRGDSEEDAAVANEIATAIAELNDPPLTPPDDCA